MTKTKKNSLFWWALYLTCSLAWYVKLYDYFFEYSLVDALGLLIISFGVSCFFYKVTKRKIIHEIISIPLFVIIPMVSFSIVSYGLELWSNAWMLLYLFLVISAFLFASLRSSQWTYLPFILSLTVWLLPFDFHKQQAKYTERLVKLQPTRKGEIHMTKWRQNFWVYYNDQLQYATIDKHIYAEAYVIPAMSIAKKDAQILVLGGDNGLIESELTKFEINSMTIVPYDVEFYNFMILQELIPAIRVSSKKKDVIDRSIFQFLYEVKDTFDVIFIDLPYPDNLEFAQYYSQEIYNLCSDRLNNDGLLITQLGDPYNSPGVYSSALQTLGSSGFNTLDYHTQIPTMGEWGFGIGNRKSVTTSMKKDILASAIISDTKWLNNDALNLMMNTGKPDYFDLSAISINTISNVEILNSINQ